MSYQKANHVLPDVLVELIQNYIDGEYLYIPRKEENKKSWGSTTCIKSDLAIRNASIYQNYLDGWKTKDLAEKYFLSDKSIQRIILNEKRAYS